MQFSGWEAFFFYALTLAALSSALFTVMARNAVHSALFLISTLVSVAGLYLLLNAELIAGVQILVYVGGVMVLFLFVVMLVSTREEDPTALYTRQSMVALVALALLFGGLTVAVSKTQQTGFFKTEPKVEAAASLPDKNAPSGRISNDTERVGMELYTRAALPFEIASVLLLVAIVGAVLVARGRKQEERYD